MSKFTLVVVAEGIVALVAIAGILAFTLSFTPRDDGVSLFDMGKRLYETHSESQELEAYLGTLSGDEQIEMIRKWYADHAFLADETGRIPRGLVDPQIKHLERHHFLNHVLPGIKAGHGVIMPPEMWEVN